MMMCTGECFLGLPFALVPSIVWLLFFVFQDKHREKTRDLIEIFLWGVFIAVPVAFVEGLADAVFFQYYIASAAAFTVFSFLAIAFVEEFGKYIVVRFKAMTRTFFDEPKDAIIYMITAALGFAAIENVSYAVRFSETLGELFSIVMFRGVSATFLHVAASGVLGYFLALSLENPAERRKFLYTGMVLATLLHGIYNGFIMDIGEQFEINDGAGVTLNVFLLSSLLIISGIIIVAGLHRLANTKFYRGREQDSN